MNTTPQPLGYHLKTGTPVWVRVGNEPAPLCRISPATLGLRWGKHKPLAVGQQVPLELIEQREKLSVTAKVEGISHDGGELSLRMDAPSISGERAIFGLLDDLFHKDMIEPSPAAPSSIESISDNDLKELAAIGAANHCRGVLRNDKASPLPLRMLSFDAERREACWQMNGEAPAAPFVIELHGLASLFQMHVTEARTENKLLFTKLPGELLRLRRRWRRRVEVGSGYTICFSNPLWPGLLIERSLLDLSFEGLSFETNLQEDLLYPGLIATDAVVRDPNGEEVRLTLEVRAVTAANNKHRCHVRCWTKQTIDSQRWEVLLNRILYPNTRVGCRWDEQTWELYKVSGYFQLSGKSAEHFTPLRPTHDLVSQLLDAAPHLGHRAVRPSERGVEAAASCLKVYSGTWLGHQMAKRQGAPEGSSPRRILRDIYLRTHEPIQNDPNFRWLLGYVEASVPWMQKAHTNFAQRYTKSGLACALPFHLWEAETSLRYKTPKEFSVQDPTPNAMPLLYKALESKPLAYREALDLVPARLGLEAIKETWQRAGLHRERQIRIAYHQGRPVAASILESTDVGVNLFHILEGVRLFPLVPNPPSRAYQALLDDAARWYQERGRHAFVYYQEEAAPPTQMTDLGAGLLWLLSAELLPEWLEHIFRLTE